LFDLTESIAVLFFGSRQNGKVRLCDIERLDIRRMSQQNSIAVGESLFDQTWSTRKGTSVAASDIACQRFQGRSFSNSVKLLALDAQVVPSLRQAGIGGT